MLAFEPIVVLLSFKSNIIKQIPSTCSSSASQTDIRLTEIGQNFNGVLEHGVIFYKIRKSVLNLYGKDVLEKEIWVLKNFFQRKSRTQLGL